MNREIEELKFVLSARERALQKIEDMVRQMEQRGWEKNHTLAVNAALRPFLGTVCREERVPGALERFRRATN